MTRCKDFYEKWDRDPNWCEKCPRAVAQINDYIDLLDEFETRGIPKERTMDQLSERAARPLIGIKDDIIREKVISHVENILNRETPTGGQYTSQLTNRDTRKLVSRAIYEDKRPVDIAPIMPEKTYRVIYADPPWKYTDKIDIPMPGTTTPDNYYPVMDLQEICNFKLPLIEENAVLFLWVTSPLLEDAFLVIHSWGFNYKTSFVWDKIKHNFGHYNSVRHEFLLVCTRGSCTPDTNKLFDSVITEERTEHSKKPETFRKIIDTLYPTGNRIELFAREKITGWDSYGNQL